MAILISSPLVVAVENNVSDMQQLAELIQGIAIINPEDRVGRRLMIHELSNRLTQNFVAYRRSVDEYDRAARASYPAAYIRELEEYQDTNNVSIVSILDAVSLVCDRIRHLVECRDDPANQTALLLTNDLFVSLFVSARWARISEMANRFRYVPSWLLVSDCIH